MRLLAGIGHGNGIHRQAGGGQALGRPRVNHHGHVLVFEVAGANEVNLAATTLFGWSAEERYS